MPPRGTSLPTCGATTRPTVVGPGRHCLQRKEEEREKEKREERERERERERALRVGCSEDKVVGEEEEESE
jgi:hypothetical protein